jgi:hypothetical protein
LYEDPKDPEFNIYRLVQVVWITNNWNTPPDKDRVFDGHINFPTNGRVIELENIGGFQQRWKDTGGLPAFQQHISTIFQLDFS